METTTSQTKPLYEEKLYPSPGIWLIATFFAGLFYFVFAPINPTAGVVAPFIAAAIFYAALFMTTPRIILTQDTLTAGKATIERKYLGEAQAFSDQEKRQALGTDFDARSYTCTRGWIDPIVKIENTDPNDQVPYWIISSRKPQEFLKAYAN